MEEKKGNKINLKALLNQILNEISSSKVNGKKVEDLMTLLNEDVNKIHLCAYNKERKGRDPSSCYKINSQFIVKVSKIILIIYYRLKNNNVVYVTEDYAKTHDNYRNKKIRESTKGIMLHSISSPQPDARVLVKIFKKKSEKGKLDCVHAFIDGNDGSIIQILPWDYRAYHCGFDVEGSFNHTHIGIEMCEPKSIEYVDSSSSTIKEFKDLSEARKVVDTTYKSAVNLFASLCIKYDLDPQEKGLEKAPVLDEKGETKKITVIVGKGENEMEKETLLRQEEKVSVPNVIVSHSEGYKYGKASGHSDAEHLWNQLVEAEKQSGIEPGRHYTMDGFREDVQDAKRNQLKEITRLSNTINQ